MSETSDAKADIIIGLLAQLVAVAANDPILAMTNAGMKQKEVANVLGMTPNAVGMRVQRAAAKPKKKVKNGKDK